MDAFEQKLIVFRGLRTFETAWNGDRSSLHESQNTDVVAWGIFNCLKGEQNHSLGDPKQTCDFPLATDQILGEFIWRYFSLNQKRLSDGRVSEEKSSNDLVSMVLCETAFTTQLPSIVWRISERKRILSMKWCRSGSDFILWDLIGLRLHDYIIILFILLVFIISTVLFSASLLFLNIQTSFKVYFVSSFQLIILYLVLINFVYIVKV